MSDELWEAMERAAAMPPSLAKIDALELIARQADQRNETRTGVHVRHHLFNAANAMSQYRHALAAYGWLRATFERDETALGLDYLLRVGAHVVDMLDPYVEIPLEQIEALYEEQAQLYRAHRRSLAPLHFARISTEICLGRLDHARRAYEAWGGERIEFCEGCVAARHVHIAVALEDDAAAVERARPLTHGKLKCDNQPINVLHELLLPLARLGDWETARRYHDRTHRYATSHPSGLRGVADVVRFSALLGAHVKARNLVERTLPQLAHTDNLSRLIFDMGMLGFLEAAKRIGPVLAISLPRDFPVQADGKRIEVEALRAHFQTDAHRLAQSFDERNRNDHFSRRLARCTSILDELHPPAE